MPGSGMGNRFSVGGVWDSYQDFFLVGERPLWVVCGLTISAIERPLFHSLPLEVRITVIKL